MQSQWRSIQAYGEPRCLAVFAEAQTVASKPLLPNSPFLACHQFYSHVRNIIYKITFIPYYCIIHLLILMVTYKSSECAGMFKPIYLILMQRHQHHNDHDAPYNYIDVHVHEVIP